MSQGEQRCDRIKKILEYINDGLKEKEEAVRLALLSAVAGESLFLLGLPGTAKSMVSRRLKYAFKSGTDKELHSFEYLMNQFSTPDEVFGPVSLTSLEKDEYKRITKGYLPEADIAFLDEIWKAGSAIQNTLLTIINEKKFHNGNEVMKVPLKGLIAASNELPAKNEGLEALWDRFLLRLIVNPIEGKDNFFDLICGNPVPADLQPNDDLNDILISTAELSQWQQKIHAVTVPENVRNVIYSIKQAMELKNNETNRDEQEKFYVSDRRWTKIVNVLKTSAFLNGRDEVDLMDCQLIEYCIWNTDAQIAEAKEIVRTIIQENGLILDLSLDDIEDELDAFKQSVLESFYKKQNPRVKKASYIKNDAVFGNGSIYNSVKRTADERTEQIKGVIQNQIQDVDIFINESSKSFKDNMFASQEFAELILKKLYEKKESLKKSLDSLYQICALYDCKSPREVMDDTEQTLQTNQNSEQEKSDEEKVHDFIDFLMERSGMEKGRVMRELYEIEEFWLRIGGNSKNPETFKGYVKSYMYKNFGIDFDNYTDSSVQYILDSLELMFNGTN